MTSVPPTLKPKLESVQDLNFSSDMKSMQVKINLPKFHFIESLRHQLFRRIGISAPLQQEAKHDQEKISAEQK